MRSRRNSVARADAPRSHRRIARRRSLAAAAAAGAAPPPQPSQPLTLRFATNCVGVHPMAKVVRETHRRLHAGLSERSPLRSRRRRATITRPRSSSTRAATGCPTSSTTGASIPASGSIRSRTPESSRTSPSGRRATRSSRACSTSIRGSTASLDGKVYGVPITMFYVEFLANKAVFDRAGVALPTDWDEPARLREGAEGEGRAALGDQHRQRQPGRADLQLCRQPHRSATRARCGCIPGRSRSTCRKWSHAATLLRELVVGYIPQDAISISNDAVYAKYVNAEPRRPDHGRLVGHADDQARGAARTIVVLSLPADPRRRADASTMSERDLTSLLYVEREIDGATTKRRPMCRS